MDKNFENGFEIGELIMDIASPTSTVLLGLVLSKTKRKRRNFFLYYVYWFPFSDFDDFDQGFKRWEYSEDIAKAY